MKIFTVILGELVHPLDRGFSVLTVNEENFLVKTDSFFRKTDWLDATNNHRSCIVQNFIDKSVG